MEKKKAVLYAAPVDEAGRLSRRQLAVRRHEAAWKLLARVLREERGVELNSLRVETGPEGKPYFEDSSIEFNLSHTRGMVVCAVSDEEIGVDCEWLHLPVSQVLRKICTDEEFEYINAGKDKMWDYNALWTLKESLMKLTGKGLSMGFENAAFSWDGEGKPVPCIRGVKAVTFDQPPGYVVSVCTRGPLPEKVILLEEGEI